MHRLTKSSPKPMIFALIIMMIGAFVGGCAMAPLTEEHTARTLGKGKSQWAIQGGTGSSLSYKGGVSNSLDMGILVEHQHQSVGSLMALTGKLQLTRAHLPTSLIFNGGLGSSSIFGSIGLIQDLVNTKTYSLSINARYNVFEWDLSEVSKHRNEEDAEEFINELIGGTIEDINGTYHYATANLANTFYLSSQLGITLSAGAFLLHVEGAKIAPNLGLKIHFKH